MTTSHDTPNSGEPTSLETTSSPALKAYYQETDGELTPRMAEAARQLKAAGVASIEAAYDGSGDNGQITTIEFYNGEGQTVHPFENRATAESDLDDIFHELLDQREAGWEIDEGSHGTLKWTLEGNRLRGIHHERFSSERTYVRED